MKSALVLAALTFGLTQSAQSQLGTGALTGVVTDATGKSVASAVIQLTNTDTGLTRQTTSSGTGDFSVPVLPTGRYSLTVEKAGFSKLEQKNLSVTVGATVTFPETGCRRHQHARRSDRGSARGRYLANQRNDADRS